MVLAHYLHDFPMCGDFNQLEWFEDKLGGAPIIRGWEVFMDWRLDTNLLDVPFYGPRFTWSNKKLVDNLIMERLDNAYVTVSWMDQYPNHYVHHEPIVVSDHTSIIYTSINIQVKNRRPYQIENWCLAMHDVVTFIHNYWTPTYNRSLMFFLSCKLRSSRDELQSWCIGHKKYKGLDWKSICVDLSQFGRQVTDENTTNTYIQSIQQMSTPMELGYVYSKQRMKHAWMCLGDSPSHLMYYKV